MSPTEPRKKLGQRIRALREAKGLTQEELGQKCSMHRSYISSIEHGTRNTSFDNLLRLAAALEIPLSTMLADL